MVELLNSLKISKVKIFKDFKVFCLASKILSSQACAWSLKITLMGECMCMCVCVRPEAMNNYVVVWFLL